MRSWIIKGRPDENSLQDWLVPGQGGTWHTRRPPRAWATGDHLFFWEATPALRIVGLGTLCETDERGGANGETLFRVEYRTGYFDHPVGIRRAPFGAGARGGIVPEVWSGGHGVPANRGRGARPP